MPHQGPHLLAKVHSGILVAIALFILSVLPIQAQWITFSNFGLIDPETGETYNAPIYELGRPWGAIPGAYAELAIVIAGNAYPIGRTTFRTNSLAAMPYLNPVDLAVPGYFAGMHPNTFVVRLYPGLFGEYLESRPFTVDAPLGGVPPGGGAPILPPGIGGFREMGCSVAHTIVPPRTLCVVGDTVEIKLDPPGGLLWTRLSPYTPYYGKTSLVFTNVQESDSGGYGAEGYCPGILTLGPIIHLWTYLVVIPPIDVTVKREQGVQRFTFPSRDGVIYALEKSENLVPATWQEITTISGIMGTAELADTNALSGTGFYRITARFPPSPDPD